MPSLQLGIIGHNDQADRRAGCLEVLAAEGRLDLHRVPPFTHADRSDVAASALHSLLPKLDALFVAVPTAEHYLAAEAAAKQGVPVFLEWPPATSLRECHALVHLAEEAGIEIGISRPLRFHPLFDDLPPNWNVGIGRICMAVPPEPVAWQERLAGAVDLACALARSSSVKRIDAEAVRAEAPWPVALAFGLRFHNGSYVQASLHQAGSPGIAFCPDHVSLHGANLQYAADLDGAHGAADLLLRETRAFVEALARRRPAPVSVLDGLHTMRLIERLRGRLR